MITAYEVLITIAGHSRAIAEFTNQGDADRYKEWMNLQSSGELKAEVQESVVFESFDEAFVQADPYKGGRY
ncbi:MAG: hypothetical protein O8C58_01065 [Candidatus Methanoperedens sp.]|nr:hypothetical protein [Candidatus Methanoperedens sp.]